MHELGFEVVSKKKGTFVDGHEREDVVEYRIKFLRRMVCLGFLNPDNAPHLSHFPPTSMHLQLKLLKRRSFFSMMRQPFRPMKTSQHYGRRKART